MATQGKKYNHLLAWHNPLLAWPRAATWDYNCKGLLLLFLTAGCNCRAIVAFVFGRSITPFFYRCVRFCTTNIEAIGARAAGPPPVSSMNMIYFIIMAVFFFGTLFHAFGKLFHASLHLICTLFVVIRCYLGNIMHQHAQVWFRPELVVHDVFKAWASRAKVQMLLGFKASVQGFGFQG